MVDVPEQAAPAAPAAPPAPRRIVHTAEALAFLAGLPPGANAGWSIVSSIPDVSELGASTSVWERFFADAATALARAVADDGVLVLTQTDTRHGGRWLDKAGRVTAAVEAAGLLLVAKKILCRKPPGATSTARAAFTHLLVFAHRPLPTRLPDLVPDVIVDPGVPTWTRGLGDHAALCCIRLVRRYAPASHTVVDPFCGEGMVLAAANHLGLNAVGVEWAGKRARRAQTIEFPGQSPEP
jgi:hypothetical protein